jgi:enoyl-CoA hydratase
MSPSDDRAVPESPSLLVERHGPVALLRLNRPESRNSLSDDLLERLSSTFRACDDDPEVRCMVLAGSDKVFASGADIHALLGQRPIENLEGRRTGLWASLRTRRTPLVAAVSGYCLGGGMELALYADIVVASETAKFGLPETQLGLIPGAGGTQMLPRAIGRAKAMDVILTGRMLTADEAERCGLVARVAPGDGLLELALELAERVAQRSPVAQRLARDAVAAASNMGLEAGFAYERRAFAIALGGEDAQEGMTAFLEKREPAWSPKA